MVGTGTAERDARRNNDGSFYHDPGAEFRNGRSWKNASRNPVERAAFAPDADLNLGNQREFPGLRMKQRLAFHGDAYKLKNPAWLCHQPTPPSFLQRALFDVMSRRWVQFEDGSPRIKLAKHPHTGEWALYQCVHRSLDLWHCFWRARHEATEGEIHRDFTSDKFRIGLAKAWGASYEPGRDHFEMLAGVNIRQHGSDAVAQRYEQPHLDVCATADAKMADIDACYLDDIWLSEVKRANQEAGSGQGCMTWFMFDKELQFAWDKIPRVVMEDVIDEQTGRIKYRRKRSRTLAEYRTEVLEKLADALLAQEARTAEKGLTKARTPDQLASRRAFVAQALIELEQEKALVITETKAILNKERLASYLQQKKQRTL